MKIARNPGFSDRPVEWYSPSPAPSLRELARPKGVTEGVSSDGSTGPMIYTPPIINSEIFELLRSSGYTPSVSHSLDSSLREGAGWGAHHSTCRPETARLRAIFIAPTKGGFHSSNDTPSVSPCGLPAPSEREPGGVRTIQPTARKPQRCGRFSSPLRNSEDLTLYHSTKDTPSVSPCGLPAPSEREPGNVPIHRTAQKPQRCGRFSSPLRNSETVSFSHATNPKRN